MAKNRTVIGIICIVLALGLIFGALPIINSLSSEKKKIVRAVTDISIGHQISQTDVEVIEVGGYNLPEGVIEDPGIINGKYAVCDIKAGDYFFVNKLSETAASLDTAIHSLQPGEVALTIPTNGSTLSNHFENGDIITLLFKPAPTEVDSKGNPKVEVKVDPALTYVRVLTTLAEGVPKELQKPVETGVYPNPTEIVLILTKEQADIVKQQQAEGAGLDYYLVCKYNDTDAPNYIDAQNEYLQRTYKNSSPNRSEQETIAATTAPVNQ